MTSTILRGATTNFNSRPSARGDVSILALCANNVLFQFTPLREGRHAFRKRINSTKHFNSRPSARGDESTATRYPHWYNFNSRPSARGDDRRRRATRVDRNFNSRPSARGDRPFRGREVLFRRISIHAPPRGATGRAIRDGQPKRFQFTPLREGRPSLHGFRSCGSISIHAPPRGATVYSLPVRCALPISIHAPPRGATAWSCLVCHHCYFNSHPSARGDTKRSLRVCVLLIFQFTPLREGRPGGASDG